MRHYWRVLTHIGEDVSYMCSICGLIDEPPLEEVCQGPRFTDNDSLRPPVNETAKRELGFDLVEEYDWSDK